MYFKKPIHLWKDVPSPNHSIILDSIPKNELITSNNIIRNVLENKNNDLVKKSGEVESLLKDLVSWRMVGEVYGLRIEKFLKDF